MKIQYANEFDQKLGMGDTTKFVYQLIYHENDSDDINIIKYFIMRGLRLCFKVDSYVAHMFFAWPFSHNTAVPINVDNNEYFISLNTNTIVFSWGAVNSNTNRT